MNASGLFNLSGGWGCKGPQHGAGPAELALTPALQLGVSPDPRKVSVVRGSPAACSWSKSRDRTPPTTEPSVACWCHCPQTISGIPRHPLLHPEFLILGLQHLTTRASVRSAAFGEQ